MTRRWQRGILLLPVALTLAVIGTLAYTMTREGSMNVSAIDAQYDTEVARYLAASGIQYAKWRMSKAGCDKNAADFGTLTLNNGSTVLGTVAVSTTSWKKPVLTITLSATTSRPTGNGAVNTLTRDEQVVDFGDLKQATIIGPGDADTTIVLNGVTNLANADTLTATEGSAHPLIVFKLPGDLDRASIIQADLKVTKKSGNANQPGRVLAVHRITRDWKKDATWTSPWTAPGGDYVTTPAASVVIDPGNGAFNGAYVWRIDSLAQAWANDPSQNFGVLLKPTALANVPFISFDGSTKPELVVRYYRRCT